MAELVVIANGVRAGRRTAFAQRDSATSEAPVPVSTATAGCQDECCAPPTGISLSRRP